MIDEGRTGNALVYQAAVNRLTTFCNDDIALNKIDYKLLTEFIHQLSILFLLDVMDWRQIICLC